MIDDKSTLPEGTDRILTGAGIDSTAAITRSPTSSDESGSSDPNSGNNRSSMAASGGAGIGNGSGINETPGFGTNRDSELVTQGQTTAEKVRNQVRSGGEKIAGQAADKARGLVGQGIERSSEALGNVSRLVGDTASGLDERLGTEYGDYARKAADAIENAATSLAAKDPDELIEDTRSFIRKSPGVALAGAAVIGFALVRLVKSGLGQGNKADKGGAGKNSTEA